MEVADSCAFDEHFGVDEGLEVCGYALLGASATSRSGTSRRPDHIELAWAIVAATTTASAATLVPHA